LRSIRDLSTAVKPLIGYGDPTFNAGKKAETFLATARGYSRYYRGASPNLKALSGLGALPETADELRAVARSLGASEGDIRLGPEATEASLKRTNLAPYRVLYFATHGLIAGEVQGLAEPSLVLSLPEQATELDDGVLTASEVAQLKLNADWVVL